MPTRRRILAAMPMTAAQLRRTLTRLGLSQRQLALRLRVDVGTVNRWATGKTPIPETVRLLLDCWVRERAARTRR
ncbi:MAG TPA: helix-turn-helix domain-containing protein [Gemmatimonadales bacterium]